MGPRRTALHGANFVPAVGQRLRQSATSNLPKAPKQIMMEKNRLKLFETVQAFLDESNRS